MPVSRICFEDALQLPLPPRELLPTAIIQARMGSKRLPGKVLMQLGQKRVLEHLLDRINRSEGIARVVLATTWLEQDDTIANLGEDRGIHVFRGDPEDVLLRYIEAARDDASASVLRITGDCPLLDPAIVDAVIRAWWNRGDPYDYGSNTLMRTFPDGMDAEVFTIETLQQLGNQSDDVDREHVTSLLVRNPEPFNCVNVEFRRYLADVRMTIDTDDDLAKLRWIIREAVARNEDFTLADLLHVEGYGG